MRKLLIAVAILCSLIFADRAQANPITFGPVVFNENVEGQQVAFIASGTVDVVSLDDAYDVFLHVRTDISGLQAVVPAIIKQRASHRDDCGQDIDVHTVRLMPAGNDSASLFVAGHLAQWACPTMHVPQFHGFEIRWEEVRLAKTIVVEQSGSVDLRLTPEIAEGGKTMSLVISARDVKADGALGIALQTPVIGAALLDPAIKNLILNQLNGQLGNSLHQSLPDHLSPYAPRVTSAKLVDIGQGKLGLDVELAAHIQKAEVTKIIAQWIAR
jgi:hypothetical protein